MVFRQNEFHSPFNAVFGLVSDDAVETHYVRRQCGIFDHSGSIQFIKQEVDLIRMMGDVR